MIRIGIDVGGTNTDAVVMDGANVIAGVKAPNSAELIDTGFLAQQYRCRADARLLREHRFDFTKFYAEAANLDLRIGTAEAFNGAVLIDPCEVTADVQRAMQDARDASKKHAQAVASLEQEKGPLTPRLGDIVELYRQMDQTRLKVFEMREEFLDCDAVYKPLVEDAGKLREVFEQSEGAILSTYKGQLDGLTRKLRNAGGVIAEKNKLLESSASEQERLKTQFDELGKFNEELYNDLFSLAGSEAISFTTQVEGRRIEKPMEEIRALIADEGKVISTLETKYPEFFKEGTNIDALKRKRLVL